ncbi:MAG: hypothetical protein E7619_10455, partial [Ruminococcaceae bacterium]|nr:hypothetical protein [Oscillospiraceae bacterium]
MLSPSLAVIREPVKAACSLSRRARILTSPLCPVTTSLSVLSTVSLLLGNDQSLDVNARDNNGNTALHLAARLTK